MHSILIQALLIMALLLLNGVFAMSELAVITSHRARLEQKVKTGSTGARRALALVDDPARFLSTVQIGITLVGVLAGAFGGATIAAQLDAQLEHIPALARFSEAIAIGTVVAVISFCSLVVGELVPKRIAMHAPERVASAVAGPMQLLARVAAPLVTLLTVTTTTILRLLRVPEAKGTRVTEEEILALLEEGRRSGVVHIAEHEMMEGVLRLGDRTVRDVMQPRPEIDWIDEGDGIAALQDRLRRPRADQVLLCRGSLDEIVGVLRPSHLLARALDGIPLDLSAAAEQPLFVPSTMSLLRLLESLKQSRQRIAVALDEFGGVDGFVALEDLIEEVVGDVSDREGGDTTAIVTRPDGSWLVDAATDVDEVFRELSLPARPSTEQSSYRTLAGFVLARLGRMPRPAEAFEWEGARFEVIDMDGRRVDKVLVTKR